MNRARALTAGLLLTLAAACGGDGAGEVTSRTAPPTITSPPTELVPYCEATIGLWIVLFDSLSAIHQAPAGEAGPLAQARAADLQPLVAAARAEAPDEVAPQLDVLARAIDTMAASGDVAELEAPEVVPAREELNAFNSRSCGWPSINVVTSGRGPFLGVPQQLGPGFHAFQVRNDSDRERRVDLYLSLEVAEDDSSIVDRFPADRPVEPAGVRLAVSSVIPPGSQATQLVDLQVGEYAFVLAEPDAGDGGVRRFVAGTVTAFRVVEGG